MTYFFGPRGISLCAVKCHRMPTSSVAEKPRDASIYSQGGPHMMAAISAAYLLLVGLLLITEFYL